MSLLHQLFNLNIFSVHTVCHVNTLYYISFVVNKGFVQLFLSCFIYISGESLTQLMKVCVSQINADKNP